jgi:hypothetical protein
MMLTRPHDNNDLFRERSSTFHLRYFLFDSPLFYRSQLHALTWIS